MDDATLADATRMLGVTYVRPLRVGGQKTVAVARLADRDVVLKVVSLDGADADRVLERARREVQLLASIDHPNVVRLQSDLVEIGTPPIAVAWLEEFLDGQDLRDRLGLQWPWSEAAAVMRGIANGLAAFHSRGVVHRDLSPSNIRLLADGTVRVMDPGFARWIGRTTITGLAQPGTVGYLSPEHVSPLVRPTKASDVFCVGILAFECLTGDVPIPFGGDLIAYMNTLREGQAPPIGAFRRDLTQYQQDLVDTCIRRQAARRFQDAEELLQALDE